MSEYFYFRCLNGGLLASPTSYCRGRLEEPVELYVEQENKHLLSKPPCSISPLCLKCPYYVNKEV